MKKHTLHSGFSLLEIAIALSVIAVLTGGILKARSLLTSAKVQAMQTDLQSIQTAVTGFENRYSALPGDFEAASAAGLGESVGDGNGQIDSGLEAGSAFYQLQKAEFIQGDFTPVEVSQLPCPTHTCLTTPFGGTYLLNNFQTGVSLAPHALVVSFGDKMSTAELAELDRKLDDGKPTRGNLQVLSTDALSCLTNDLHWDETTKGSCHGVFLIHR